MPTVCPFFSYFPGTRNQSNNALRFLEAKEPAFLQRLRGQYGTGDTSGRLERPAVRPRKAKDPKDDEEDEPVYIDEESNEVITKEEYKALAKGETANESEGTTQDQSTTEESFKQGEQGKQSNLTEVGGQRKRKQAKVVGEESKAEPEDASKDSKDAPKAAEKPKKSKKAKKIKLSFDEE